MDDTGNRNRWEHIRPLGEGGQGKVSLVRDTSKRRLQPLDKKFASAVHGMPGTTPEQKRDTFQDVRDGILDIVDGELPKNQGALKQLHDPTAARAPETASERIRREMQAMSEVTHPNLLRILDANPAAHWFVSEFHPNGVLSEHSCEFKGDLPKALRAWRGLVAGVAALHDKGLVHRDIKPANVFVSSENDLILGDLGLVFFDDGRTRISETYENVGSRDWMAPWVASLRVDEIPQSSDVFSLGKLLWAMVSGRRLLPFWYYDKPEHDVEQMFRGSPYISYATDIFKKTIVEEESHCWKDAQTLLDSVDKALRVIDTGADAAFVDVVRHCRVCARGEYVLRADRDPSKMHAFGFSTVGTKTMKIFTCSHCGHMQMFSFEEQKALRAWPEKTA